MEYMTTPELAKHVRAALKEAFPDWTFSVRSKSYSGGSSITVGWLDGPTVGSVERVVGKFEGSTFDGMIDLKESRDVVIDGKRVLTDWVLTHREISNGWREEIVAELEEVSGQTVPYVGGRPSWDARLRVYVDADGRPHRLADSEPGEYVSDLLHRITAKRDSRSR